MDLRRRLFGNDRRILRWRRGLLGVGAVCEFLFFHHRRMIPYKSREGRKEGQKAETEAKGVEGEAAYPWALSCRGNEILTCGCGPSYECSQHL